MRDLLWRVCFRRKLWPQQVTGDTNYGTTENIVAIEDAGIRAYVPLPDFEPPHRLLRPGRVHLRPGAGRVPLSGSEHPLRRQRRQAHGGSDRLPRRRRRSATPAHCKAQCTDQRPGPHGAPLARTPTTLETVRGYHATEPYQKACASGKSGSSRCLPRPRNGTAYAGSGCAA